MEAGAVQGIAVWNLSRFSRSAKDALVALDRIESAGGRLYSATEDFSGDSGKMMRTVMLAFAENERDRARASFAASTSSALERGVYLAGKDADRVRARPGPALVPDPDTSPVVVGVFERRAKGMSWAKLARWLTEQGASADGVRGEGDRPQPRVPGRSLVRPPDEAGRP